MSGKGAVRVMLFVGGPTTEGFGQVVGKELQEPIRSHKVPRPPPPHATCICSRQALRRIAARSRPGTECRFASTCDIEIARCIANGTAATLQEGFDHLRASRQIIGKLQWNCRAFPSVELCVSRRLCHHQERSRHVCLDPQDLVKETASHYKKARKFFDTLAAQLVRQGHTLDVFACSLDQVPPPSPLPPRGESREHPLRIHTSCSSPCSRFSCSRSAWACFTDLLCR